MNNRNGMIPIIRIELEHAKHALYTAITEAMLSRDEEVKAAIEEVMTPERIQRWLQEIAEREIRAAIQETVKDFFVYGEGAKTIKEAVFAKLKEQS